MRSVLSRLFLLLVALMIAASVLPAFAEGDGGDESGTATEETGAAPAVTSESGDGGSRPESPSEPDEKTEKAPAPFDLPWWEINPPVRRKTRTRVVVRQAETLIESMPAEGLCYTAIKRVNVRSQPSTQATRVMTIKSAGTEFNVSARVKNSSGEIWYAVKLANGTLGYIRSDLLNTDHVILLEDPYSYEADVDTHPAAASESGSDVINIISTPAPTPEIVYVTVDPSLQPTPTPILVYVTPDPAALPTPQVIYITTDKPDDNG